MPLVGCNYTHLEHHEHTCNRFALVTLREPAGIAALLAGVALLFGPLQRRRSAAWRAFRARRSHN